ncbi:MAG: hypothetical protein ACOCUT_03405 [bacterium]
METTISKGIGSYYELHAYKDVANVHLFSVIERIGRNIKARVEDLKENLPKGTKCTFGETILDWEHKAISVTGNIQIENEQVLDAVETYFLHQSLSQEGRNSILQIKETKAENQKIKKIEISNFDDEGTTVSVTVVNNDKEETFYVQTVDGEFRSDLGCWILTDFSGGDIDYDDYPNFNFPEIIKKAEKFIQEQVQEEKTNFKIDGEYIYLLITDDDVKVVVENSQFVNKQTSSYQRKYSDPIETFDSREDALEYLESLEVNKNQSLEL